LKLAIDEIGEHGQIARHSNSGQVNHLPTVHESPAESSQVSTKSTPRYQLYLGQSRQNTKLVRILIGPQAACALSRMPNAPTIFATVSKLGLPSGESAL
jgi:hypothetical protein